MPTINWPWAIILCQFNDVPTIPQTPDYYANLFTVNGHRRGWVAQYLADTVLLTIYRTFRIRDITVIDRQSARAQSIILIFKHDILSREPCPALRDAVRATLDDPPIHIDRVTRTRQGRVSPARLWTERHDFGGAA